MSDSERSGWTTYVWVDSADDSANLVASRGGRVLLAPADIPRAGRPAVCADPSGAVFGLWQAAENRGAQLVNAPGSWDFSPAAETAPHWSVTFAVADADAAFRRGTELGATVVTPLVDTEYTRAGAVRDPQGAALTLSEYRPPSAT